MSIGVLDNDILDLPLDSQQYWSVLNDKTLQYIVHHCAVLN